MRTDNLQTFVKLRRELMQEKEQLSRRLAQINDALGELPAPSQSAIQAVQRPSQTGQAARPGRKPAGSGPSLRELVMQVLREGPKTKEEVLDAVQRRGYKFQTNNPLNSLGVILYGKNPKFSRVDGRFAPPSGSASNGTSGAQSGGRTGKRQISAAARARIAEAQRRRWAAARKSQGK